MRTEKTGRQDLQGQQDLRGQQDRPDHRAEQGQQVQPDLPPDLEHQPPQQDQSESRLPVPIRLRSSLSRYLRVQPDLPDLPVLPAPPDHRDLPVQMETMEPQVLPDRQDLPEPQDPPQGLERLRLQRVLLV